MKTAVLVVMLLSIIILHPYTTAAQPTADIPDAQSTAETPVCEYQGKWEEPNKFQKASIDKDEIRQCLYDEKTIKNHHVVFEHLVKAWEEAITLRAQETLRRKGNDTPMEKQIEQEKTWDLPIKLEGGVLHANTPYDRKNTPYDRKDDTGGIRLGAFRDPTVTDTSKLTEEERKTFGTEKKYEPIALIRPAISWRIVYIDSVIITFGKYISLIIFSNTADFSESTFSKEVDFSWSIFSKEIDLFGSIFSKEADFVGSTFSKEVNFGRSIFSELAYFLGSSFSIANFSGGIFSEEANFSESTFSEMAYFSWSIFSKEADFSRSTFSEEANFSGGIFSEEANFSRSTFSRADFSGARFKDNVDFRDMIATEMLKFDNTAWENRIDLRGMNAKELRWNSKKSPSNVKGIVDFREALIGWATFKEIRFQDLVDFSRATFGQYKVDLVEFLDVLELINIDFDPSQTHVVVTELSPQLLFENNTFEKESDFLHVTFDSPTLFINNRFRSTLDLTGSTFDTEKSRLCLSYNRIQRPVFEPEYMGNPPGLSPSQQLSSLFAKPLKASKIQPVVNGNCALIIESKSTPNAQNQRDEPLVDLYKTLGKSFREANDRTGINEAWYLETVAKRGQRLTWSTLWKAISLWFNEVWFLQTAASQEQADNPSETTPQLTGSSVGATLSWLFGDIPSRYAVDVWRTVWISIGIMVVFYVLYLGEFIVLGGAGRLWRWIRRKPRRKPREVHILGHPERHRAFRLRIFEPIHRRSEEEDQRKYAPWRDAATLSVRSFLKIGLGTVYPDTRLLKFLTTIEWLIGAFMLIHFILAVKNNLPFVLPFLGIVN